jgi:hypothetical protein
LLLLLLLLLWWWLWLLLFLLFLLFLLLLCQNSSCCCNYINVLPDLLPFRRYCCWYFRHRLSPAHTAWGLLPMNYMTQILILFVSHLFDLDSGL